MERLPAEITRMIASLLSNCDENPHGPRDIKSFRLVSTQYSIIGAEYLLPVIYLTFQSRSFERLRSISQHPLLSLHVKHLLYEAAAFNAAAFASVEDTPVWKLVNDSKPPVVPREDQDEGTKSVCRRKLEEFKAGLATTRIQLRSKFEAYRVFVSDQESIRRQKDSYNVQLVKQAIARLPNLTAVTLNFEHCDENLPDAFERAYANTHSLFIPEEEEGRNRHDDGVMQLWSILCGVVSAETQLKSLQIGSMGFRFLQKLDKDALRRVEHSLKQLETLIVNFKAAFADPDHNTSSRDPAEYHNYHTCGIFSAAKNLKVLGISISDDGEDFCELELKHIVRTTIWASLREVDLKSFDTTEVTLIGFLQRHAGSLEGLGLHNIFLHGASWTSTLPKIRDAVKLKDFRASGYWDEGDFLENRDICTYPYSPEYKEPETSRCYELGAAVKKYILQGGTNPLLDPSMWP